MLLHADKRKTNTIRYASSLHIGMDCFASGAMRNEHLPESQSLIGLTSSQAPLGRPLSISSRQLSSTAEQVLRCHSSASRAHASHGLAQAYLFGFQHSAFLFVLHSRAPAQAAPTCALQPERDWGLPNSVMAAVSAVSASSVLAQAQRFPRDVASACWTIQRQSRRSRPGASSIRRRPQSELSHSSNHATRASTTFFPLIHRAPCRPPGHFR